MPRFLSIGLIPKPLFHFPLHQHETWELVLYTHGRGVATVGERAIPFHPGLLVCMPPRVPHKEDSKGGYRNIYIHTYDLPAREKQLKELTAA